MDTALTVITGPSEEPVCIDILRRHLRVDYLDDDDLLGMYLTSARMLAEQYLSRALITQTLQWTVGRRMMPVAAGPNPYVPLFFPGGNAFGLPNMDRVPLELPRSPAQSVSTVQISGPDGALQTLDASSYVLDSLLQPANLRLLPDAINGPINFISITYIAGYGDNPQSIPMPIIHAVMMMAAYLYENRGDTDAEIPAAARALMDPYRIITFGGQYG